MDKGRGVAVGPEGRHMADVDYYGADFGGWGDGIARVTGALSAVPWMSWAGALSTVALVGGLAVWGIDLATRDVREVPVIQALEGPMRMAPEEPGGAKAPHQGLALSEITAGGVAAPAPESITLAPPPADMDVPSMAARAKNVDDAPEPATALGDKLALLADDETTARSRDEMLLAAAPEPAADDDTIVDPTVEAPALWELIEATVAEAMGPAITRSARPPKRPATLGAQPARSAALPPAAEVDPATLKAGTRVVQLGAFDTEGVARGEWLRLQARYGDYLAGKGMVVQKAASGEQAFWRLRAAGFADGTETRRLCTALLAQGQPCIPVTIR